MFVFNFEQKSDSAMELLGFKNKILELCDTDKIENVSDVLMNAVMTHNTTFLINSTILLTITKSGYKRYGNTIKQTEPKRNKITHQNHFANQFQRQQENVKIFMIVAEVVALYHYKFCKITKTYRMCTQKNQIQK